MLTNPDMLHYAILAYPANWERFLSRLRYVVVDECHEYRGIFGTNVSYLFRRLRTLCRQYGSSPTFIATSATVQSPQEHMERLTGVPFACVGPDEDGSSQGERKFWMVRPAEHPHDAGRKITLALAEAGLTVLTFSPSRTAAERMIARSGRDNKEAEPPFVRVYRAGLRAEEREEIEAGLRDRSVRAVFSTSALELGIDIGAIDVVVCVGLPTTMIHHCAREAVSQTSSLDHHSAFSGSLGTYSRSAFRRSLPSLPKGCPDDVPRAERINFR